MAVRLSEVKSVCTSAELDLVKASRKPELEKLTPQQLKRHAVRARKHFDKWQKLARSQARTGSRQAGFPKLDTNTQLKEQIFRETLDQFETRLAQLEPAATAGPAARGKPKQVRAKEHRAARASVRAELAEKETRLKTKKAAKKSPTKALKPKAAAPTAPKAKKPARPAVKMAASKPAAAKKTKPAKKRLTAPPAASVAQQNLSTSPAKQRAAKTATKKARIAKSGLTTRTRGHVSAQGKRAQARRDVRR